MPRSRNKEIIMRVRCDIRVLLLGISLIGLTIGCKKKVAVASPAPPPLQEAPRPTPPGPTASITVEPPVVEAGQAATLKWSTTNATALIISGLGAVGVEGKQEVRPTTSTTYELVANGPGGSASVSATVSVMPLVPALPPPVTSKSLQDRVETELADIYFDYDQSEIRDDARTALAKDAGALHAILADFPTGDIVLEGHCDERGSPEYNLGLGDRRAASARAYLDALGVVADRLTIVSYGNERPQCTEPIEGCWQKNRRVHFSAGGPPAETN
jgi:peptidoglycan-associated lipoprotein